MQKIIRIITICCAILVGAVHVQAQNLVSWWQGEGNILDSAGTNSGFLDVTNITFSYISGVDGQAFDLNGAYITVPDAPSLQPSTLTIQAWVKSAGSQSFAYLLTKVNNQGGAYGVNMSYSFYTASGGLYFFISTGAGTGAYSLGATAGTVWDGNWHQITGTYDGLVARLYVDGMEQTNNNGLYVESGAAVDYSFPDALVLGAANTSGGSGWKGGMDEVRIFDHALTATDVLDTFNNPASPALTNGLTSYFNANGNVDDPVGGNNGTANAVTIHIPAPFAFGPARTGQGLLPLGGYAYAPASTSLEPTFVTVQAWMKSAGREAFQYIISKDGYHLYTAGNGGVAFWNSDAGHISPTLAPGAIWDGAWHLVTGVYDGTNRLFVDGIEVGSPTANANPTVYGNGPITFGAFNTGGGSAWSGALDDIKVFDGDMTSQQILANYVEELGGNLVGWWKAEGDANDVISANNGSIAGAVSYVNSKFSGQAFNTSGGAVVVPDSSALQSAGSITVEAFIQSSSPGAGKYIVSKSATSANASYAFYTGAGGGLSFYITTAGGRVESPAISSAAIWDGAYHHVAGVYDGQQVRIYLDGVEVGNGTAASGAIQYATTHSSGNLLLGDFAHSVTAANFAGSIDDVKIFAGARTAQNIRADYASGIAVLLQPQSKTVQLGSDQTLSVTAFGPPPLNYQWRHQGTNILGATNSALVISNLQVENLGGYDVQIVGSGVKFTTAVAPVFTGQAFKFGSGAVDAPNLPELTPTNFTVQFWIRGPEVPPTFVYAFAKSLSSGVPSIGFYTADTRGLKFIIGNSPNGGTFTASGLGIDTNIWNGDWHQVTGTWDGELMNLYLDGSLIESVDTFGLKSVAYNTNFQNGDIIIGGFRPTGPYLNVDMDEIKFFDHALTDVEVLDTFNNPTGSVAGQTGLLGWWKGEGNALDSAGLNNAFLTPPATKILSDVAVLAANNSVAFTNVTVQGGAFHASLVGATGSSYVIQRAPTPNGAWTPVLTNTTPFSFNDPIIPTENQFYRAISQ